MGRLYGLGVAGAGGFLCLCAASAQVHPRAHCRGVEVRSVQVHALSGPQITGTGPSVRVSRRETPGASLGQGRTLQLLGPLLGSMDSQRLDVNTSCSGRTLSVEITALRSDAYQGSVQKFSLWQPEVEVAVVKRPPLLQVEVTWRVRLTSGAEVHRSELPGEAPAFFPVALRTVLR